MLVFRLDIPFLKASSGNNRDLFTFPDLLCFSRVNFKVALVILLNASRNQVGDASSTITLDEQRALNRIRDLQVVLKTAEQKQCVIARAPFPMITRYENRLLPFSFTQKRIGTGRVEIVRQVPGFRLTIDPAEID